MSLFAWLSGTTAPQHVHDWGRWEKTQEGTVSHAGLVTGTFFIQQRVCKTCGRIESDRTVNEIV